MPKRIPQPIADADEEEILVAELRSLRRKWLWPYRTDRATAGTTTPDGIDDSGYSLRRARFHEELSAEMDRLARSRCSLREQIDAAEAWIAARLGDDGNRRDDYFKSPRWLREHGLPEQ
jgi:hypothetical protein